MGMRVLSYIDELLLAPTTGRMRREEDCLSTCEPLGDLLEQMGIERHENKGVWGAGTTKIAHRGAM